MLVKNITGGEITYNFADLTLGAGSTQEIDNSFIDNLEFQKAQADSTISVLNYEETPTVYTARINISQSPNQPSNDQKGALVASNSPSAYNPYVTHLDTQYNDLRVDYTSATTFTVVPIRNGLISVNYLVKVESSIVYDFATGKVINSSGNDTLNIPSADTLYYIYIANRNAALGEKTVALSETAPADGVYLTSSKKWRVIGYLYSNSARQIENKLCIASEANETSKQIDLNDLTGVQASSEVSTYEVISGTELRVVLPKNWHLSIDGNVSAQSSTLHQKLSFAMNVESDEVDKPDWESIASSTATNIYGQVMHFEQASSLQQKIYAAKFKGPATAHSCDRTTVKLLIKRYK